jgi:Ulp1 family protease
MVFLNDTTINFYIKIISKYILPRNTRNAVKNFHFFNTYFCSKLRNEISTMSLTNDLPMSSKNRFFLQQKMEPVQKKLKTVG